MADDDFEIDIYGDDAGARGQEQQEDNVDYGGDDYSDHNGNEGRSHADDRVVEGEGRNGHDHRREDGEENRQGDSRYREGHRESRDGDGRDNRRSSYDAGDQAVKQGVKRKEGSDDRHIDPGATSSLLIQELSWWNTDDDIRGWAVDAKCEDELKEITFSEHKVNGKSKGFVFWIVPVGMASKC